MPLSRVRSTLTCSCVEYHFVKFGDDGIKMLQETYPKVAEKFLPSIESDGRTIHCYPKEDEDKLKELEKAKPRTPRSLHEMEGPLILKNEELTQYGHEQLVPEEFLSARMYTGPVRALPPTTRRASSRPRERTWHRPIPSQGLSQAPCPLRSQMYYKYNVVLRGQNDKDQQQNRSGKSPSEDEVMAPAAAPPISSSDSADKPAAGSLWGQWAELCKHNTYTTTLHAINSAVVKLGKLMKVQKVYRGLSGANLPPHMLKVDEKGVRGGVEVCCHSPLFDSIPT